MLPERTTGSCRAKRGTAVGDLLTIRHPHADTPRRQLRRRFSDRLSLRCRAALRADSVFAIYDHEIGDPLACRAKCLDDRVHLRLKAVANQPRSHHYRRNSADGAKPPRAMLSNFEAHDFTIVNRRRIVLNRLVGEHEPDLVVASRAVGVDGFHCSVPLVCGGLAPLGLLVQMHQVNGITSADGSRRCAITSAGSCASPNTDVDAASASIALRARTVAL